MWLGYQSKSDTTLLLVTLVLLLILNPSFANADECGEFLAKVQWREAKEWPRCNTAIQSGNLAKACRDCRRYQELAVSTLLWYKNHLQCAKGNKSLPAVSHLLEASRYVLKLSKEHCGY